MLQSLISSIFSTNNTPVTVSVGEYLIAMGAALVLGILIALVGRYKSRQTKSLSVALVLLPVIVLTMILLVNKQFGAGLAVAGAFSLMRFRSAPVTARDMVLLALSIAVGLCCGLGFVGIAAILTVLVLAVLFILTLLGFGEVKSGRRVLNIVIPESLNYDEVFSDLFEKYTKSCELIRVKTTNMGSLFKLRYAVELRDVSKEKEFIDELRVRNGNLEISIMKPEQGGKTEI